MLSQRYTQLRRRIVNKIPDKPGLRIIEEYAKGMDAIVLKSFEFMLSQSAQHKTTVKTIAVLAQGGYGRHELNLYSDIDLLFLTKKETSPDEEECIKSLLYMLWDLGLEVGYFVRTMDDIEQILGADVASTTALIESRFLAGNPTLFSQARKTLDTRITGDLREWYIKQRLDDIEARRHKWGRSVYLLEPNIKEGRGGLRDVHSIQWLEYVLWKSLDIRSLLSRGLITEREFNKLRRALNFLHRVRNVLHLISRRKDDLLNFQKQERVAKILGYKSDSRHLGEEKLMQTYYSHAHFIESLSSKLIEEMLNRYAPALLSELHAIKPVKRIGKHFRQVGSRLHIIPQYQDEVISDPFNILTMFLLCAEHDLHLGPNTIDLISAAVKNIDKRFRQDARIQEIFLNILSSAPGVGNTLFDMHRTGFLELLIPEFQRVRHLVRLDSYHKYTVDEHLLRAVQISEKVRLSCIQGNNTDTPTALRTIMKEIKPHDWGLFNLALLLHDIGKGSGRRHVLASAQLSITILSRLGLAQRDQDIVYFLVSHHQLLSHVALRRNLDEPRVIELVARGIMEPYLLNLLYIFTYCDINAVSPDAWNTWKGQLLYELFKKVAHYLEKGELPSLPGPQSHEELIPALSKKVREIYGTSPSKQRLSLFLSNLPDRYLATMDVDRIAEHFVLLSRLSRDNPVEIKLHQPPESNLTEICFVAFDRLGLFRDLCLILSSSGINIINANIFTTTDGYCLDMFYVTDLYGRPLSEGFRLDFLKRDFIALTNNKRSLESFLKRRRRSSPVSKERFKFITTRITLRNYLSRDYSVLEIKTIDRPWVLYTITSILRKEGINIERAFITTEAYRVVDVFYITDFENNKIDEEKQIKRLRGALKDALSHMDLQEYLLSSRKNENQHH